MNLNSSFQVAVAAIGLTSNPLCNASDADLPKLASRHNLTNEVIEQRGSLVVKQETPSAVPLDFISVRPTQAAINDYYGGLSHVLLTTLAGFKGNGHTVEQVRINQEISVSEKFYNNWQTEFLRNGIRLNQEPAALTSFAQSNSIYCLAPTTFSETAKQNIEFSPYVFHLEPSTVDSRLFGLQLRDLLVDSGKPIASWYVRYGQNIDPAIFTEIDTFFYNRQSLHQSILRSIAAKTNHIISTIAVAEDPERLSLLRLLEKTYSTVEIFVHSSQTDYDSFTSAFRFPTAQLFHNQIRIDGYIYSIRFTGSEKIVSENDTASNCIPKTLWLYPEPPIGKVGNQNLRQLAIAPLSLTNSAIQNCFQDRAFVPLISMGTVSAYADSASVAKSPEQLMQIEVLLQELQKMNLLFGCGDNPPINRIVLLSAINRAAYSMPQHIDSLFLSRSYLSKKGQVALRHEFLHSLHHLYADQFSATLFNNFFTKLKLLQWSDSPPQLTDYGHKFLSTVNEDSFYSEIDMDGGHAVSDCEGLFCAMINSLLHPDLDNKLQNMPEWFRDLYLEGLQTLKQTFLTTKGFPATAPIISVLDQQITTMVNEHDEKERGVKRHKEITSVHLK